LNVRRVNCCFDYFPSRTTISRYFCPCFSVHSLFSASYSCLPSYYKTNSDHVGRRRKIRCIYAPDNPDICSECFARGSRCIDQEHASSDVVVDHRKNLRERVSRLEALVDSLLDEKTVKSESHSHSQGRSQADTSSPKAQSIFTRETLPPTPLTSEASSTFLQNNQRVPSGHHVPILSVFEDAVRCGSLPARLRMLTVAVE
jgi:hypothetical protein